jgi:hypothetical protein
MDTTLEAGQFAAPLPFPISRAAASPETIRANVLACLERGLPELVLCKPHKLTMYVAAGGPSLKDTWNDLRLYTAAVNHAHDWLIERGVIPHACGLIDPSEVLAAQIKPHRNVTYFVASMCHPAVFDKLKEHKVVVWHASSPGADILSLLPESAFLIAGGSSMALRWRNLGYALGFRRFEFHGVDSSFETDHHVYSHEQDDDLDIVQWGGFKSHPALICQASEFFRVHETFQRPGVDQTSVEVRGSGLLPTLWRKYVETQKNQLIERHARTINKGALAMADNLEAFGLTEEDLKPHNSSDGENVIL